MSVELLDTPRFHGYRVRRQIAGKTYQEYFSLKDGGKRLRGAARAAVKDAAKMRDLELAGEQRARREQISRQAHVDAAGHVRGILFRLKKEKSGTETPVFQVGIMSTAVDRIVNTTVSVNHHGLDDAWKRAVDYYCHHKQINKRAKAYRELIAARPTAAELGRLNQKTRKHH